MSESLIIDGFLAGALIYLGRALWRFFTGTGASSCGCSCSKAKLSLRSETPPSQSL